MLQTQKRIIRSVTFAALRRGSASYTARMNRRSAPLAALAVALLSAVSAWAQSEVTTTWKWKDASGRITVSDLPPPASVAERDILVRPGTSLRLRPPPAAASAPGNATKPGAAVTAGARVDPELEARRRKLAEDQQAQQRAQEQKDGAVRAENCGRARGHLAALENGERMTRTGSNGEREVLDDKGRAEEMQRARSIIASDCGK
jgi:Domain of unknown function (DUF4124)